eukprot:4580791-Alexandrium_andersonii.AAC.1
MPRTGQRRAARDPAEGDAWSCFLGRYVLGRSFWEGPGGPLQGGPGGSRPGEACAANCRKRTGN